MNLRKRRQKIRAIYEEYPQQFWLLVGVTFIDMVGNALIFPFFALFITDRFDVGMAQVGIIFAIFAGSGLVGSTVGGALADKMGRKAIVLFALVMSALGNLVIVTITNFQVFYLIGALLGMLGSIGGPARQAMVADLLPEEKRAEGFGIFRISFNLAVVFGPLIGGLLAGISYTLIFIVDAITSIVTATILFFVLKETRPEAAEENAGESLVQTFRGYGQVLRDMPFMTFVLLGMLVHLVYVQMNTTLPVYLRDMHGVPPQGYGIILSMNAAMVVFFQLGFTRHLRQRGYPYMLVLAAGSFLYAIGFGMYGFVSVFVLFMVAMVIITIGEMLVVPVGQAVAAGFARDNMRGRYMAIFGFTFSISTGLGTFLAGLIMDNADPNWVWYLGGILAAFSALSYAWLHRYLTASKRAVAVATS
ncbi:MAG: MFS transporter [Chloroflexi bacterium]|nr:MFS transporter [Chloroflexota bacterium]